MPDPNEPKKETVRIPLPTQPPGAETSAETTRINLPARPPTNIPPIPPSAPIAPLAPAQNPPSPQRTTKETARIELPTEPPSQPAPTVQMKKTQPLFTMPETTEAAAVPLSMASDEEMPVETVSVSLCWAVLGISALILVIQIWNYFS